MRGQCPERGCRERDVVATRTRYCPRWKRSGRRCAALRAVAMNHGALMPGGSGSWRCVRAALGAREDKAAAAFVVEQVVEHVRFAVFGNFEAEDEHFGRLRSGAEREADGILGVVAYELRHAPSMVAEKQRVWRSRGKTPTIRRIAGRKPMSSMRSASSRTSVLTPLNETSRRSRYLRGGGVRRRGAHPCGWRRAAAFRQTTATSPQVAIACAQGVILRDDLHREFPGRHKNRAAMPEYAAAPLLHYGKKEREGFAVPVWAVAITSLPSRACGIAAPARELASKFRRDESLLQRRDRVSSENFAFCFLAGEEGGTHE